jgi:hypothetical protein
VVNIEQFVKITSFTMPSQTGRGME